MKARDRLMAQDAGSISASLAFGREGKCSALSLTHVEGGCLILV